MNKQSTKVIKNIHKFNIFLSLVISFQKQIREISHNLIMSIFSTLSIKEKLQRLKAFNNYFQRD